MICSWKPVTVSVTGMVMTGCGELCEINKWVEYAPGCVTCDASNVTLILLACRRRAGEADRAGDRFADPRHINSIARRLPGLTKQMAWFACTLGVSNEYSRLFAEPTPRMPIVALAPLS